MSEGYRLVFSGEVLEGQHAAVVKKRLAAVLKLDAERMEVLFKGQPVVVKKSVDKQTAGKYQQVFKKAGARLRVLPDQSEAAPIQSAQTTQTDAEVRPSAPPSSPSGTADTASELNVLPAGTDVLNPSERASTESRDINTSHLTVQGAVFAANEVDAEESDIEAPNVDHLTLAELGAQLGVPITEDSALIDEIETDFDLADVGAILGALDQAGDVAGDPDPAVDIAAVNFEVAERGADLGQQTAPPTPPPPDTSHLKLDD